MRRRWADVSRVVLLLVGVVASLRLASCNAQIVAKRQEKAEQKAQSEFVECTFSPDLALTRDVLENHNMGAGRHESALPAPRCMCVNA
jgi:hypothetical protein